MLYGMPYKGSKNAIAKWITEQLPSSDCFVDLFGGGGAITHAAMLSGKWKRFIYNDFDAVTVKAFRMAVNGEFADERRWISREDFQGLKNDPYAALCFSFGNNGENYAYSKEVEPWKRALHYAYVYSDVSEFEKFGIKTDGTRADIMAHHDEYKKIYIGWYIKNVMKSDAEYELEKAELEKNIRDESERLREYLINARNAAGLTSSQVDRYLGTNGMAGHYFGRSQWEFPTREVYIRLQEIMPALDEDYEKIVGLSVIWQSLQSLESLQRLQRLQSLQRLQRLQIYNRSYEDIEIPKDATVYCDIPYRGTSEYRTAFDHEKFYNWALSRAYDVYISEYDMPDGFYVTGRREKTVLLSSGGRNKAEERLYCNRLRYEMQQMTFFDPALLILKA